MAVRQVVGLEQVRGRFVEGVSSLVTHVKRALFVLVWVLERLPILVQHVNAVH